MADGHVVRHRSGSYEVHRRDSSHVTQGGETPVGDVWEVTRDGATITSFPASGDDTSSSIQEKVVLWLRANEDRPDAEIGRN